jgi:hypothetical protein
MMKIKNYFMVVATVFGLVACGAQPETPQSAEIQAGASSSTELTAPFVLKAKANSDGKLRM